LAAGSDAFSVSTRGFFILDFNFIHNATITLIYHSPHNKINNRPMNNTFNTLLTLAPSPPPRTTITPRNPTLLAMKIFLEEILETFPGKLSLVKPRNACPCWWTTLLDSLSFPQPPPAEVLSRFLRLVASPCSRQANTKGFLWRWGRWSRWP
jgi:hypothetical protein